MKIGIATFFESENYGTVLQAYALQKYLETMGHITELLYIKRSVNGKSLHYKTSSTQCTLFERVRYKVVSIIKKKSIQEKGEKFKTFRNEYLRISKYYKTDEQLINELEEYDLFISGGDQIWNPYHKVFSLHYMFDFLPEGKPRIAYGSSFGVASVEDANILCDMERYLQKYQSIGVREKSGVELIGAMGIQATQVIDPVFLLRNEWGMFVKERPWKKKYCLVYALIEFPKEEKAKIAAFAKKQGLDVVILPFNRQNCLNGFHKEFGLSPQEFLNYIAHAEYVFTNSFHGLAFSILFQKQFTLLGCNSEEGLAKRTRLVDLLSQLGIKDRALEGIQNRIDYTVVNKTLGLRLKESKTYIKESINKIGEKGYVIV